MDVGSFLTQAYSLIQSFGQMSPHFKVITILTLFISAWKVSAFRPIWDRLGWFKTFLAPFLSFILAIVSSVDGPFTVSGFLNALMIGVGSVGFHEMLDSIKLIPGIGPKWMSVVNYVSKTINDTTQLISDLFQKKIEK